MQNKLSTLSNRIEELNGELSKEDATKDMDYFDDLVKPIVPGIDQINLKDYL